MPWWREIKAAQWRALAAAQAAWMLDAMDVMLFTFALNAIRAEFSLSGAVAGTIAAASLLTSAVGGSIFGYLADRFGRARALSWAILVYSITTASTATAQSPAQMLFWRMLLGIGLGGAWPAGAVLVAETWPAEHRGKAIGIMQCGWAIGYLLAAALSALLLPVYGWRVLFAVGIAPAALALWVQRRVTEPSARGQTTRGAGTGAVSELWAVRGLLAKATLLTTTVLFAYWGLFTWLPAYLGASQERGGAGLSIVTTSIWMAPLQIGAFLGYLAFGFLADRFGRRPVFVAFVLAAAALVPLYGAAARSEAVLLALGPAVGFFGHGYFSVFGAMLAELFPQRIRGTAQAISYSAGRAVSALAPVVIGAAADRRGIGAALAITSVFFVAGALIIFMLPETRGKKLD